MLICGVMLDFQEMESKTEFKDSSLQNRVLLLNSFLDIPLSAKFLPGYNIILYSEKCQDKLSNLS